eukprot:TRINITY_DN5723_c0_g2_i1.p1 TRINITY_DN5723_c0_g2~~TRINITY_DN5723_c0_g2_i1.p1  ORF type:complete len:641 (-),score=93.87 TRINITY_DN5723_c0_g2_i1:36-1958(-)
MGIGAGPVVEGAMRNGGASVWNGNVMISAEEAPLSAACFSSSSSSSWHGRAEGDFRRDKNDGGVAVGLSCDVGVGDGRGSGSRHSVVAASTAAAAAALIADVTGVPTVGRGTTLLPSAAMTSATMRCRRRRLVVRKRMAILAAAVLGAVLFDWHSNLITWAAGSSAATLGVSSRRKWRLLITAMLAGVTALAVTFLVGRRSHALRALPPTLCSQRSSCLSHWPSSSSLLAQGMGEPKAKAAHDALPSWPTTLGLVGLYVVGDIGVLISTKFVAEAYVREAAQFCSSLTAWCMALAATGCWSGIADIKQALIRGSWKLLVVACFFSLAVWAQMKALALLPVFFAKLVLQLKLPCTVFFSTVILRRRYSLLQLQALGNISLAVITFTCLRNERSSAMLIDQTIQESHVITARAGKGLFFCGLAVCFSSLGTVLCEKAFLDDEGRISWWTTVAYLKAGESCVAFALMSVVPNAPLPLGQLVRRPLLLFKGFDQSVWMVVVFLLFDAWVNVLLVKTLSSVSKVISKCVTLIVLYLLSVFILQEDVFWLPTVLLVLVVANGISLFAYASVSETGCSRSGEACRARGFQKVRSCVRDVGAEPRLGESVQSSSPRLQHPFSLPVWSRSAARFGIPLDGSYSSDDSEP